MLRRVTDHDLAPATKSLLAIAASGFLGASERLLTGVWTPGFAVMGVACVVNAVRCGRVHCYFTGPFLLLVAAASLLHGVGVVSLGPAGWQRLCILGFAGAAVLMTIPEHLGALRTPANQRPRRRTTAVNGAVPLTRHNFATRSHRIPDVII